MGTQTFFKLNNGEIKGNENFLLQGWGDIDEDLNIFCEGA